jgi:predicted alpha-1,2-mannosidase
MAHWSLQTEGSSAPWFFRPADRRIEGIRSTHQLSPWIADYGSATFLPVMGDPSPDPSARASSYRPEEMQITPDHLHLDLLRYSCAIDLVPTERGALMRLTFAASGAAALMIDLRGADAELHAETSSGVVTVRTSENQGGVPKGFATYYAVKVDRALSSFEVRKQDDLRTGILRFDAVGGKPVDVRIGTSFISFGQAYRNLTRELADKPFAVVRDSARETWNKQLGRIIVEGGTEDQRRTFYSSLYRVSLFPRMWHEEDDEGNLVHYSPYSGSVEPGVMYADHGYWDVYRAWYPLMSILDPARLGEILQAWVNASKEGGWMPQFPCPGYRACMTGSLIDSVFGDAAAKQIAGFDLEGAYQALRKHATSPGDPDRGYGRRGVEEYLHRGYISTDNVEQSAVETLDSAYGDFCIAQVARAAGHPEDAAMFERRSLNWKNVFDPETRFMRGKKANGQWLEHFNPHVWGTPYVEGSAWQHRFSAPHDISGLIQAMGGEAAFTSALEEMLNQSPRFEVGIYGREIHEMSEMAAVKFGQYAHSNQPVHHVLYLFAEAGRPDLTQYWARRVMDELYTPDQFPGDEDTGSMSAWYVLSALGFYPVCPGKPNYTLGSPLFDRATLMLQNGRRTVIEARHGGPKNVYVKNLLVNGAPHKEHSIAHGLIANRTHLSFEMTDNH